MSVKVLTEHHLKFLSLKGGCTGSSEPTLVKMTHSWKSRDIAHIRKIQTYQQYISFRFREYDFLQDMRIFDPCLQKMCFYRYKVFDTYAYNVLIYTSFI